MNTPKRSSLLASSTIALVGCLSLLHTQGVAAQCSQSEIAAFQNVQQRAYAAGMSMDLNQITAVLRESQELYNQLSPGCQRVLQASGGGGGNYGGYQNPSRGYGRPPSVYYSPGTDTYIAPNVGACGPSGCISFD